MKIIKTYSKLNEIPSGHASDTLLPGCLVLEGGAFRTLYTQGFLDAMMELDLNLSCVIGVSGGALTGVNYVSGQIGRSATFNLGYRRDPHYVGSQAIRHSHSLVDVGFVTEDRGVLESLDQERFYRPDQRLLAVTTDCLTGRTAYFEKGKCSDILLAVRASATMPYISPMVEIDGRPYLDGGCSCKIPFRWAIDQGFEKIVVIKTREVGFRKPEKELKAALKAYRRFPAFARSLARSNIHYNRQCDQIDDLHLAGRLLRIAPSRPVTVSRLESDMEKLGSLYFLGYHDCRKMEKQIRDYLGA